jgi:hypothetical protein
MIAPSPNPWRGVAWWAGYAACVVAALALQGSSILLVGSSSVGFQLLAFLAAAVGVVLAIYVCREPYVRSARITIAALELANPGDHVWLSWMYPQNRKVLLLLAADPAFAVRMDYFRRKSFVVMSAKSITLWSQRGMTLDTFAIIPASSASIVSRAGELPSNTVTLSVTSSSGAAAEFLITPSDGSFGWGWPAKEKAYREFSKWASRSDSHR